MNDSSVFTMNISPPRIIPILLGGKKTLTLSFKNLSTTLRLYNLSLNLVIPNGLDIDSSDIPFTNIQTDINGNKTVKWVNIKDLTPLEVDYLFTITLKSDLAFKDGSTVPFGYVFSDIQISASVDTMPRGTLDIGNKTYDAISTISFKTVKYSAKINVPSKVLKGAGTSASSSDYTQIYTTNCIINNNSLSSSMVNIYITLDDGIRYLGNISTSGSDSLSFSSPIVERIEDANKNLIRLTFLNMNLSPSSENTISFNCAVWNKYNDNTGDLIFHGTSLISKISIIGQTDTFEESSSFSAMDMIINKWINITDTDIGDSIKFYFNYKTGQYYSISDIQIIDILPDGLTYTTSSTTPTSIIIDSNFKGTVITYHIGNKPNNYSETISITSYVNNYYTFKLTDTGEPKDVVAADTFLNNINISGLILGFFENIVDFSNAQLYIKKPHVYKRYLKAYYRDGGEKNFSTLAPNDLAEFLLIYDSLDINAIQKAIYIDDYFPLSIFPTENLEYIYDGYVPSILIPDLVSPHGVSFFYGDIPGNSKSTITFKSPVGNLGTTGENINLLKLKGIDTTDFSYSQRDQVIVPIGKPNMQIYKSVTGPNINSIKPGETYIYTVKIENTNTIGTETDAFDFELHDNLSDQFTVNPLSLSVTGNGSYLAPYIINSKVIIPISKLSPGQFIELTYPAIINNGICPNLVIRNIASNTNPYSQVFNSQAENYKYTNLTLSASSTIKTSNILFTKKSTSTGYKVGSNIIYNISITVPQGTTAYNLVLKDTLPQGQLYVGPAFKDNIEVNPTITGNTISFSKESIIDATLYAKTINYSFTSNINEDSQKPIGSITTIQINSANINFKTAAVSGNTISVDKSLNVTINHPNIVLSLNGKIKNSTSEYTNSINVYANSLIDMNLQFFNNTSTPLKNGFIEIPLDNSYTFVSIDDNQNCSATYDDIENKLILSIINLNSGISGFAKFTLKTISTLISGTIISTIATATQYKNDISAKIYSGETSNTFIISSPPGVTFLPYIGDRVNDSTSYRVSPIGSVVTIVNTFVNSGYGLDDYTISLQPLGLDYSLYVNNTKIIDVQKNTDVSISPDTLKNINSGESKTISVVALIPVNTPLDAIFRFIVTMKSNTEPYPSKTIINIDPF